MAETQSEILFVCSSNGGKSQMAAALARKLAGDTMVIHSAGTKPGTAVNEESRVSIEAVGATFDGEFPKAVEPDILQRADRIVILGNEAQLEAVEGMQGTIERWEIDEPSKRDIHGAERMDLIRDEILGRVETLLQELR